jgi:hypothetical protein
MRCPALLTTAATGAPCGFLRCSPRRSALLPTAASAAPHRGRRCSLRPPVLLPTVAGIAPYGVRRCSSWLPALLPVATSFAPAKAGVASYYRRCCSLWQPTLPRALAVCATRGGRRCYDWWPPVLHGADWQRGDVSSPVLLRAVAAGSRAGALVLARGDDAREAGRHSFHGNGAATIC